MAAIIIEGGVPLMGTVTVSGAKNSALKVIPAAMFSNEDVVVENVPKIASVLGDLEMITSIGGKAEWLGDSRIILNGSQINSSEIPYEVGSKYRTALLLAGPLLYRFGKASIPKFDVNSYNFKTSPNNRIIEMWKLMGIDVEETPTYYKLSSENIRPADVIFRTSSHMSTDSVILTSLFVQGETTITNASEETEIDDVIAFCNEIGGNVERIEPRKIKIIGTNIFKSGTFSLQGDKAEAASFATAAIVTGGNIVIRGISKMIMIPFVNFLSKIGARYEFSGDDLKIWSNGEDFKPISLSVSPTPGFVPDWKPLATLILTKALGESFIHDTVYINRNDFIRDLNRMGAKIETVKPSSVGMVPVISDDSYDFEILGEPETVLKISGPVKLKGSKLNADDIRFGALPVLSGLCAEGKTELSDFENIEYCYENFYEKLINLGAKIWRLQP